MKRSVLTICAAIVLCLLASAYSGNTSRSVEAACHFFFMKGAASADGIHSNATAARDAGAPNRRASMTASGATAPQSAELLELSNRALMPGPNGQFETSSVVIPPGDVCPDGCVFVGYGNSGSASLMGGKLSCLGQPDCLKDIPLARDAPGGKVKGVGETITTDEKKLPSLGGNLDAGVCKGGAPSTQDKYLSGGGTDNVLARAFDGSVLYMRAGVMFFPDTQANCQLDLRIYDLGYPGTNQEPSNSFRQVDVVYRLPGGGQKSIVMKGRNRLPTDPQAWNSRPSQVLIGDMPNDAPNSSALDRFDLYANPFDQTIYASGGSGTGKRGVNRSLLFASTDNGQSWVKKGYIFGNQYGAYAPFALAATKNRLYAAVCAATTYPPSPTNPAHPVLGWSNDGGQNWETSEGGALSDYRCDNAVPASNLAGGGFRLKPDVALAPVHTDFGGNDIIRIAFPSFHSPLVRGQLETKKFKTTVLSVNPGAHEDLIVLNVTVTKNGRTSVSHVTTIEPPSYGSVVRSGFVRTDPGQLPGNNGRNTAVLWWLESDNPNYTSSPKMRARYLLTRGANEWGEQQPLAVTTDGAGKLVPVEWTHNKGAFGGDYDNGSFYWYKDRLNFFIQWMQDDPTNGVPNIHYNVVSVLPEQASPPDISDLGLILLKEIPSRQAPNPCLSCPPMQLTFFASQPGPVDIQLAADGKPLGHFGVSAVAGVNVIDLGSPQRTSGAVNKLDFTVTAQMAGRPTPLTRAVSATRQQVVGPGPTKGVGPSEPVGPVFRVKPTQH